MRLLETEIVIDAPPQTVWAVLDDIERYPEWNPALPALRGRTTVGQRVVGTLRQPNVPEREVNPTITRIVGARELRWLSQAPGGVFSAEHIFILEPNGNGGTRVRHNEVFDGPMADERWPSIDTNLRTAYHDLNHALKARAEALRDGAAALHPAVGRAVSGSPSGTFTARCRCASEPVEIEVNQAVAHNHLCGCSKCWKPAGAAFAQIAVVPAGSVSVVARPDKLEAVDATQKIERQRCKACGTHLLGTVSDPDHHFYGLEFVHPELATDGYQPKIEFAAFVSSLVETGTPATGMASVRAALGHAAISAYDAFSPELMDIIAWHRVKLAKATA
ncbi:MAG: glutathione-dependent formaldehyde-activating protein [Mesorhizobium sp.]|nr:glutathione-dependent formaldehyde-activating protein [bacterium M00.F.Ca.ET.205.01.1.1]TGU46664.1 glutathione-dependent formaldehyde-activating protein [bacterium M00.F.Ca.ET.152.01.1.1]TGV31757.1 glutathione-dependent formaldehyde-activating protein [Mesorhizobium sp. M00.F.Ca.ET.186.01.1.1]TGZ38934.1 glutathione-dependent formaldehyde-activating protein [bacterium M00.F.Ca.ET.162.01.1.1]TJW32342.1 MAG: glutathione-dependent formaldehyde-activating protein [Mesorhizobium sp.]